MPRLLAAECRLRNTRLISRRQLLLTPSWGRRRELSHPPLYAPTRAHIARAHTDACVHTQHEFLLWFTPKTLALLRHIWTHLKLDYFLSIISTCPPSKAAPCHVCFGPRCFPAHLFRTLSTHTLFSLSRPLIPAFVPPRPLAQVRVSLRMERKGGKTTEKLGIVEINLAEFAGRGREERRYLLQSEKKAAQGRTNSILRVAVELTLLEGDPVFRA